MHKKSVDYFAKSSLVCSKDLISDEVLISAIRKRPTIWNTRDDAYKNRMVRPVLWREIAKELNIEPNLYLHIIKNRWHQIRTCYLRNKTTTAVDSCSIISKPYRHMNILSFLDGSIVKNRQKIIGKKVLKKPTELVIANPRSLYNQPEMVFKCVEVKQESDGSSTNDQQTPIETPSVNVMELFTEIKTESYDCSPSTSSPKNIETISSSRSYIQHENKPKMIDQACQTEKLFIINSIQDQKDELIAKLKRQNEQLRESLATIQNNQFGKIPIETLKGQNKKVQYLTGFPNFVTMENIYKDVENCIPFGGKMSKFDVFFMTWLKFKLDLPFNYLSIMMNVSPPTISRLFYETFVILYGRLSGYVKWPNDNENQKSIPTSYKQIFGDRRFLIIDSFEIFSDRIDSTNKVASSSVRDIDILMEERLIRASKLKPQPQSLKYLMCVSTSGTIIYLSKPFDTGISNHSIVWHSGFLDMIETDDIILADREFVYESVFKEKHTDIVPMAKNVDGKLVEMELETSNEFTKITNDVVKMIFKTKRQIMMLSNRLPLSAVINKYGEEMYSDFVTKMACTIINLTPSHACDMVKEEMEELDDYY